MTVINYETRMETGVYPDDVYPDWSSQTYAMDSLERLIAQAERFYEIDGIARRVTLVATIGEWEGV